jgi:hypothetical protein
MVTKRLHNMSDEDFEATLPILAAQIAAQLEGEGPEGEAAKAACDTLANEFLPGLTVQEWLAAACRRLGVDPAHVAGL